MKITVKTHQYTIAATYTYVVLFLFSMALRMAEVDVTGPLATLKFLLLQSIFVFWFVYLGYLLASLHQPKAAVLAFMLYAILNTSSFISFFVYDFNDIRTFSFVSGIVILAAQLFLIVQVFRLKGTVISKYYRLLGIIMGSVSVIRISLPFFFGYISENFSRTWYLYVWMYADLYSSLLAISIIVLLKRTVPLLSDYTEPLQPDDEYL